MVLIVECRRFVVDIDVLFVLFRFSNECGLSIAKIMHFPLFGVWHSACQEAWHLFRKREMCTKYGIHTLENLDASEVCCSTVESALHCGCPYRNL